MVTCIGEALIDFVSTEIGTLEEAPAFLRAAGGAPANVAIGIAKLGGNAGFVGKVGDDPFGHFLASELERAGVDVAGLCFDTKHKTRLAFVSLTRSGERDFSFWESHPADETLTMTDIDLNEVRRSRIVHISSFLLLSERARVTAFALAAGLAGRESRCWISFDPNIRLSLWRNAGEARRLMRTLIEYCTILRLNAEEASFLTDGERRTEAARALLRLGPRLVVVTHGKKGCSYATGEVSGNVAGFSVKAVDTTGCGDAFLAALLQGIAAQEKDPGSLNRKTLTMLCRRANAAGALTALSYGAAAAMPTSAGLHTFIKGRTRS